MHVQHIWGALAAFKVIRCTGLFRKHDFQNATFSLWHTSWRPGVPTTEEDQPCLNAWEELPLSSVSHGKTSCYLFSMTETKNNIYACTYWWCSGWDQCWTNTDWNCDLRNISRPTTSMGHFCAATPECQYRSHIYFSSCHLTFVSKLGLVTSAKTAVRDKSNLGI